MLGGLFNCSEWWNSQKHETKMQGENCRHQCQLRCHAKGCSHALFGKPLYQKQKKPKNLKTRQDSVVLLKRVSPRDKESSQWGRGFMENKLQWSGSTLYCITIYCTSSFRCSKRWRFQMQRQQWIKNGQSCRHYQPGSRRKSSFTDGLVPPEEFGVGTTIPEVQSNGCAEEGLCYEETLWKTTLGRIINGCYCSITRFRRTSNWRNIGVRPSKKVEAAQKLLENSEVRMSRCMNMSSNS